jgi:quercetin dioxygenase-like cupin family protein
MKALLVGQGATAAERAALAAAAREVWPPGEIVAVAQDGAGLDGIARIAPPAAPAGPLCAALLAADRIDAAAPLLVLGAAGLEAGLLPLAPGPLAAWLRALAAPQCDAALCPVAELAWLSRGGLLLEAAERHLLAAVRDGAGLGIGDALRALEAAGMRLARPRPGPATFRLDDMVRGWFVGPFAPAALATPGCEVAVKRFAAGEREAPHHHRAATEVTLLLEGRARMGAQELGPGDGIVLPPFTESDFEALTDVLLVAVKSPGRPDDKFPVPPLPGGPA